MRRLFFIIMAVMLVAIMLVGCAARETSEGSSSVEPSPKEETAGSETGSDSVWAAAGLTDFAENFDADDVKNVIYRQYWEAGNEYTVEDKSQVIGVFDAINAISITGETDEMAEDFSDIVVFVMEDGTEYKISFNMHNLETENFTCYTLEGDSGLWDILDSIAELAD